MCRRIGPLLETAGYLLLSVGSISGPDGGHTFVLRLSTDHPTKQRAIGRPKMHAIIAAAGRVAGQAASAIRAMRGGPLRRLAAWIAWNEGLVTLRSIAASLRLRSEGHVLGMIRRCEREFSTDRTLLGQLDGALVALRA